jgi:hypothetical protein
LCAVVGAASVFGSKIREDDAIDSSRLRALTLHPASFRFARTS